MTNFPTLQAMFAEIESAGSIFEAKASQTYNDEKIAAAVIPFNAVLERAAAAILKDMGDPPDADTYIKEWKPRGRMDTWFGPEPVDFLRHLLAEGKLHRRGALPDESALR